MPEMNDPARKINCAAMALWILNHCPEFYTHWARLRGFSDSSTPMERMIDQASGYDEHKMNQFIEDVGDLIIDRLPPECFISPEEGNTNG